MSRSGYDDGIDQRDLAMWRGMVASASRGKRGQAFFVALAAAMDAMPEKALIAHDLVRDGAYCALGVLGAARGIDLEKIDPEDAETVAATFNIATCLAQETVFMNDEAYRNITPQERWTKMRAWVARQVSQPQEPK